MTAGAPNRTRSSRLALARRHPWLLAGAAALAVTGVAVVLVWFQPQALLFDTVVDEDFPELATPGTVPADAAGDTEDPAAAGAADAGNADAGDDAGNGETERATDEAEGPVVLAAGGFESRNRYTVTGEARVYELADGSRTLRLEDFESTNGPDLYVYLTAADHADDDSELDRDVVDLGELRGNIGNQNYGVPEHVDLAHYDTVVIWCLRFTTSFGAADLVPAS